MNNKRRDQIRDEKRYDKIMINFIDKKIIIVKKYRLKTKNIKNNELEKELMTLFRFFLTIISAILSLHFK